MKKNLLQSPRLFFFLLFLGLSSGSITLWAQDTEYDVIDEESEQKKVCWPLINTSKTEATTQRMKTDTPAAAAVPNAGGLAPARNLYTAVEVPNLPFPDPATIEIYDLFGNPLIINGTTLSFGPSLISATLAAGALGTTPGYHWVGYISNSFQPDNSAVYYYNVFHRWFAGMPGNYHNFGGRQWNSDNSGFANFSDTVFLSHPVTVSIVQPVSCYGFSDGILQANTNPLNFYTYALNGGTPVLSNTFPGLPAGTYTVSIIDTFNNSYDTVINLGQPPSLGSKSVISHCGPFTWPVSGLTYNTSGTYFFNSIVGLCPKTDTLVLTVTNSMSNSSTITAYNFYTWPVNGFTYNTSGTYFFNTNSGGCNVLNILNLTIINTPYNENVFIDQPISCYGANDGSIQAIVFPNYPNIVYQLDGGVQTNTFGYFSGLGPGTHTVCAISGTISVCKTIQLVQPAPLTVTILTDSLVSCLGTDGGLHAHISGGTPLPQGYNTYWYNGMSILLNPFPNNYDTVLTNLMQGAYSLTVEDDHGCFTSTNVQLNAKPLLQVYAWAKPIRCHGGTSNIQLSFSGGTAPVSYTISGNAIVNPYVAGTYTVLATDAKGCTATTSITLSNPPEYTDTTYADACMSYYWSINGQTYTATGVYDTTLQSLGGCLLQNVLHLTIHSDTTINSLVSTCNSYTWPLNNVTYTLSGNYTYTHVNAFGCVETNH
ncbi:MAG TPA: hypothetical protein PLP34_02095, partial [Chitinophagaceae bacterium]|nr:hypothetical protein [Chitinophagaceae bacterium]